MAFQQTLLKLVRTKGQSQSIDQAWVLRSFDHEGAAGAWASFKSERRVFPILFGKITQQEFYHLPRKCKTLLPKQNPGGAWRHPDKQLIIGVDLRIPKISRGRLRIKKRDMCFESTGQF